MSNIFTSATRLTLLIVILTLVGINVYALINYPDTIFATTWSLFKDIALMSATYFYAKSTQEGGKPLEREESKIDISTV